MNRRQRSILINFIVVIVITIIAVVAMVERNQHCGLTQRAERDDLLWKSLQVAGQAVTVKHQAVVLTAFSRKAVIVAA